MKKKLYIILGLVLLVAALAVSAAQYMVEVTTVADSTGESPDFQQILTDKLLPEALRLVTEIGALLALLWPQISAMMLTVKGACAKFGTATDGVTNAGEYVKRLEQEREEQKRENEALRGEVMGLRGELRAVVQAVGLMACGSDALVANGTARKIMEAFENEGDK